MTKAIRSWRRHRLYNSIVRELRALSPRELGDLGIAQSEIDHLALELSRTYFTSSVARLLQGESR
jgi:uncharacterized protein YjiS (DUF1127 family)